MLKKLIKKPFWGGFLSAVLTLVYCGLISGLFKVLENYAPMNGNFFIGGILILGLLVFSVAVCGVLIFGIPAYLFFKKDAKEGFVYLGYTIAWMFLLVLVLTLIVVLLF